MSDSGKAEDTISEEINKRSIILLEYIEHNLPESIDRGMSLRGIEVGVDWARHALRRTGLK